MAVNKFFNAEYYLATNIDLIRAGLNTPDELWAHYELYGANEAIQGITNNRAPNPWFDVNYYLAANPDLNKAGVTGADALNHYATWGILEGREFSATVSASDFDAETYVEENSDVAAAFGIVEGEELTAANKADLLGHYLAYGYIEGREGAGDIADTVQADNVINVTNNSFPDGATSVTGTIMNDKFVVADVDAAVTLAGRTIDGLGGNDTVVIGATVTTGTTADENVVTFKNVENVVVRKDATLPVEFNSAQTIETLTVEKGTVVAAANFITANAEVAQIVNNAAAATVALTTGQEAVNLTANGAATILNVNNIKGNDLTVNVDGGKSGEAATVTVGSVGSPTLTTVTIDGSASVGDLALVAGANLAAVQNVVMKGGAGDNAFTTSSNDVKANFTAEGGAGVDTFTASAAIDTFTGGAGNDVFDFSTPEVAAVRFAEEGKKVGAVDTITDFKAGDELTLASGVTLTEVKFATGNLPAGATLEDALTSNTEAGLLVGEGNIFQWGSDAYVVLANNSAAPADPADGTDIVLGDDVQLIKLAGVSAGDFFNAASAAVEGDNGFIFA